MSRIHLDKSVYNLGMELTPKQLKLAVSADCAKDPALADKITFIVGFEPRWSKMSVMQMAAIQSAWESLINHQQIESTLKTIGTEDEK